MKASLREQSTEARNALSREERQAGSREIENRLFGLPEFIRSSTVMFFASFRSEVDTIPMIRKTLAMGRRVVLPKVRGRDLALLEIEDLEKDVSPGVWGIPEPVGDNPVALETVDIVIVPGLAFDELGNRLGHGAGFYDRLLARYQGPAVGLAFEVQILPRIPVDSHDCPVRKIITEKRIITVKQTGNQTAFP